MGQEALMIIAAAIKFKGIIFTGYRHGEIFLYFRKLNFKKNPAETIQGFIDHKGNFLTRVEAAEEAKKCGQVKENFKGQLTSENVW